MTTSSGSLDCPGLDVLDRNAAGSLSASETESLRLHLESCARCRRRADDVRQNLDLLGSLAAVRAPPPAPSPLPTRIGAYRLGRELGRGGMGVVYEAEQESPRRRVAVKVLHAAGPAAVDADRRLRREARALARLAHPGIAAILEAGRLEDGRTFIAMELVDGAPITRHAEEQHLDREARLRLFCGVVDAIASAHRRGVVHRDLKPSNVLVDRRTGTPKVLDFGLAKLQDLDEEDEENRSVSIETGRVQGTLPYMSPEQVTGRAKCIDVRTDVFSLGVLLYELLFGARPYDVGRSLAEATRVITEVPPSRPRRLDPSVDPDLETIVLKALAKDPDERYAAVAELGADVERFLRHEPIHARPPSAGYLLRKLVRRHRTVFALSAALLVIVTGTAVGMTILYLRSERARHVSEVEGERARRAATLSESVRSFLVGAFHAPSTTRAKHSGPTTARDLLDGAAARLATEFDDDLRTGAAIAGTIAGCYKSLGAIDDADALYEEAYRRAKAIAPPDPDEVATAAENLALVRLLRGRLDEARAVIDEAWERVASPAANARPRALAALRLQLANLEFHEGRHSEALLRLDEASALLERADPPDALDRARVDLLRARALRAAGELDDARAVLARARTVFLEHADDRSADRLEAEDERALLARASGDTDETVLAYREVIRLREAIGLEDASTSAAWNHLANALMAGGRHGESEAVLREALARLARIEGEGSEAWAAAVDNLSRALFWQERWVEARAEAERSRAAWAALHGPFHPGVANSREVLGLIALREGDASAAESELREALRIDETALPAPHPRTETLRIQHGRALLALRRWDEAGAALERAFDTLGRLPGDQSSRRLRAVEALLELAEERRDDEAAARWRRALAENGRAAK